MAINLNWTQKTFLFTRNNKRNSAFCIAFIAEMDVLFPLLSQILRPFGKRIKADFYQVLKFEHPLDRCLESSAPRIHINEMLWREGRHLQAFLKELESSRHRNGRS